MSELENQLRAYADHVEGQVGEAPADRRGGGPRMPLLFVAAAAVLAVVAAIWLTSDDETTQPAVDVVEPVDVDPDPNRDDVEVPSSTVGPAPTSTSPPSLDLSLVGADGTLDPGPLSPRWDVLVLRTPDAVLVWGGDVEGPEPEQHNDGALLDLETGEWQMMASSPLPAVDHTPLGWWYEERALIARRSEVAIYDPVADAWSPYPSPPIDFWGAVLMPERNELLVHGASGGYSESRGDLAVLDLVSGEWRVLDGPAPFADAWDHEFVWAGDALYVAILDNIFSKELAIVRWDPSSDAWESLGALLLPPVEQAFDAAWTGDEILVIGHDMSVVAFDPAASTWRELPALPLEFQDGRPRIFPLDDGRVVVERSPGIAVLYRDETWRVVPRPRTYLSAVDEGIDGRPTLWGYGRDGLFTADAVDDVMSGPELLIGFVVLAVEPGDELLETGVSRGNAGSERPWATVSFEGGGACTITSRPGVGRVRAPIEDEVLIDGWGAEVVCDVEADRDEVISRLRSRSEPRVVEVPAHLVPNVVGLFADSARQALENLGLIVVVEFVPIEAGSTTVGRVIAQVPDAGFTLRRGEVVTIRVAEAV